VNVKRQGCDFANGFNDEGADGEIRHEMPIHHVDVEQVGTCLFNGGDLIG
jgi:hypothetical protein